MKIIFAFFAIAASAALGAIDLGKPIAELKLNDGRTIKNVVFVSYSSSAIMAKWDGGRGTIAYEALPTDIAAAASSMRPKATKTSRPEAPKVATKTNSRTDDPKAPTTQERRIGGQVFVTTRGAGAYRFTDATVIAYPSALLAVALDRLKGELSNAATSRMSSQATPADEWLVAWAKSARECGLTPIASATTNADGEYLLNIPSQEEVFLFCYTTRRVGGAIEQNRWIVPVGNSKRVDLTVSNQL